MHVREGSVRLVVPAESTAEDGVGEAVFYNPDQELNRDLTVAVLRVARERLDVESYLDAHAATGVRGVRAGADGLAVTLCDRDPEAVGYCEDNLARNDVAGEAVRADANVLMHRRGFDAVDLDPFGTPMPFADAAARSARRLLCVTATDTAPLCGAHFDSGVRSYGAVPRNTEYHAEMGVRVLVSALVRAAARRDVGARPVLSHVTRHYARTYLRLDPGATPANDALDDLGYVHHCPECLSREHARGLVAAPPEDCPNCGGRNVLSAGPLYLAPTTDPDWARAVADRVTGDFGAADEARSLLKTLEREATVPVPTHYDQHRLCKRWGRSASAMDDFLDGLRAAGYDAVRTHYGGTTFRTDADVAAVRAATRE